MRDSCRFFHASAWRKRVRWTKHAVFGIFVYGLKNILIGNEEFSFLGKVIFVRLHRFSEMIGVREGVGKVCLGDASVYNVILVSRLPAQLLRVLAVFCSICAKFLGGLP